MRILDKLKLILHECKYEKSELVLSVILQILTFTAVCFMFTLSLGIDDVCGQYMRPLNEDGYEFTFRGYTDADIDELEEKGFYNISVNQDGELLSGYIGDTDGIWVYKIQAVLDGKDIWNEALEEILGVILFCQVVTGTIGIAMFIIMLNNLTNSFTMKLIERKNYINMLYNLGCSKGNCKSIYYGLFSMRNVLSIVMAGIINGGVIAAVNNYLYDKMKLENAFPESNPMMLICILLLSVSFMWISFEKQWRRIDETGR